MHLLLQDHSVDSLSSSGEPLQHPNIPRAGEHIFQGAGNEQHIPRFPGLVLCVSSQSRARLGEQHRGLVQGSGEGKAQSENPQGWEQGKAQLL